MTVAIIVIVALVLLVGLALVLLYNKLVRLQEPRGERLGAEWTSNFAGALT